MGFPGTQEDAQGRSQLSRERDNLHVSLNVIPLVTLSHIYYFFFFINWAIILSLSNI